MHDNDNLAAAGAFAATFVNPSTGGVYVAIRGTDLSQPLDVITDLGVIARQLPQGQINDATPYLTSVTNNPAYVGYLFAAGGHSLAGEVVNNLAEEPQFSNIPCLAEATPNQCGSKLPTTSNILNIVALRDRL